MSTTVIPRTQYWFANFHQAFEDLHMSEEDSVRWADSVYRLNCTTRTINQEKEKKFIKVIEPKRETAVCFKICKATLMNGKPCTHKAACGDFCKRHKLIPCKD